MNELQQLKLDNALNYAAHCSMGIYPQCVVAGDGARTERTPYQEGWNDAIMTIFKNHQRIKCMFELLYDDTKMAALELLESHMLEIVVDNELPIVMYINMNDTFGYACADSEEISVSELIEVRDIWKKYGHHGLTAWSAVKRNVDPIDECKSEQYTLTMKEIMKDENFD